MKNWNVTWVLAIKGAVMGIANVIPGVSGGTVAFVTGIYTDLIQSIKACDLRAVQLLLTGKWKAFSAHINLPFLIPVFAGACISVVSLAKLLEFVYTQYEVQTVSFFFGLILASIPLVVRQIQNWTVSSVIFFLVGTCLAGGIALLKPMQENGNALYLVFCGMVAISSMILPGISGSYVLLIMGNYLLVLRAVGNFDLMTIIPFALGCGMGIIAFSHLLSYLLKKQHDPTVALLAGFVLGSLVVIWPWKDIVYMTDASGETVIRSDGSMVASGYQWFLPQWNGETLVALICMAVAVFVVVFLSRFEKGKNESTRNPSAVDAE